MLFKFYLFVIIFCRYLQVGLDLYFKCLYFSICLKILCVGKADIFIDISTFGFFLCFKKYRIYCIYKYYYDYFNNIKTFNAKC